MRIEIRPYETKIMYGMRWKQYKCWNCGTIFWGPIPQVTNYCCRLCELQSRKENDYLAPERTVKYPYNPEVWHLRTCKHCGRVFPVDSETSLVEYCTSECAEAFLELHPQQIDGAKILTCKHCGEKFVSAKKNPPKYCSDDCRKQETEKRRVQQTIKKKQKTLEEHPEYKHCLNCGAEINTDQSAGQLKKYCSKKCLNAYRARAWRANKRRKKNEQSND